MLPEDIFGQPISTGKSFRFDGMPLAFATGYRGTWARIGETECVIVEPKEQLRLAQAMLVANSVAERANVPCIIHSPQATAYQRKAMTGHGVAWILGEETFSLPFLAVSCSKADLRRRRPAPFSANAQRIATHAIDGAWLGLTATELADKLCVSLSSTCNYLRELEAALPQLVSSHGRTRYLAMPDGMDAAALLASLSPYLQSPVAQRIFLKRSNRSAAFPKLPASGMTALSLCTPISDEPWKTCAVFAGDLNGTVAEAIEVTEYDDPDNLLEVWRYRTDEESGMVNSVSLLLDLEEISATQQDERLDDAIEQFRTEAGL